MKTRRTIKGTSAEGVVEEAYTPSNPPPYPVVDDGSYPNLGAGYLATQIKITANSSALVGWNKFAEISYGTASMNYSYSAILLVNGVHSTQLSMNSNTSESGKIEIDFYKEVSANPTQIGISVLSGNINVNEICAVLDSANSKIYLYSYFKLYQSISYLLISEEQGLSSKPAKVVFVSEYYGTTAPTGAIYAVVRNNAGYANTASYAATASYADTAETLTGPFTVGKDTTTATTGYVKFASVSLPAAYRSASARFEILDKNPVNAQTQMCGAEVVARNVSETGVTVTAQLLYGSAAYLSKIYACVKKGSYPVLVDLYFDITSSNPQETISCIKPLFTFGRTTVGVEFTFISDNEPVSALPTDTTNTQLSTVCVLVTEAVQATKATQDANGNVINTTYATKTEVNAKYTKPASGIPETDLSEEVQAKLNSGGGAENLIKTARTTTEGEFEEGLSSGMVILDFALNLQVGKKYTIKYKHEGVSYEATAEAWDMSGMVVIGSFDSGSGHEPIDIIPGDENSGIIFIIDNIDWTTQQTDDKSTLAMIYFSGVIPSIAGEFISITEVEEPIQTYKIKQISVSSGETMSSVVGKITSAIEEELTAQSRSSAVVTVALNDLTISDAVMSGNATGRVFLETSYMSVTSGVSQNKIVFITPLVRAVGDSTSIWGSGSWAVSVQFGKFNSNIAISTGGGGIGGSGAGFKDLSNFVSDKDTTIDLIIY